MAHAPDTAPLPLSRRLLPVRLAAETVAVRTALPWLLRAWPLDRLLRVLGSRGPQRAATGELIATVERMTGLATRGPWPVRTACLERALLRYALLRRHGVEPRFVIGVRPGGRKGFEAHAWLTLGGAPIMEREGFDGRPAFEWPTAQ